MSQPLTDGIDAVGSTASLTIPADPACAGTVRYFAATIARHAGLSEELIDDLRLAVSEACAEAIEEGGAGPIRVDLSLETQGIVVQVTSPSIQPGGEVDGSAQLLPIQRLQLVGALFPDADAEQGPGMKVVRFTVPHAGANETAEG
jgi:anti-sigma regulatory factor (Ser/Thr protein kinase)